MGDSPTLSMTAVVSGIYMCVLTPSRRLGFYSRLLSSLDARDAAVIVAVFSLILFTARGSCFCLVFAHVVVFMFHITLSRLALFALEEMGARKMHCLHKLMFLPVTQPGI